MSASSNFFARMRAAAHQNRRVRRHADLPEQRRHVEPAGSVELGRVKFQVAHDAHGFGPAADFPQTLGIGFVLGADAGERGEQRPEQKSKPPVAAIGTVGQPGVGQKQRECARSRARQRKFGQISASTSTMASGLMVSPARGRQIFAGQSGSKFC